VDFDVMLLGEQPGDKEDLAGKPFVGPAGRLLDLCLEEAGIICLGATAAQSLLGSAFRVTQHRAEVFNKAHLPPILATIHPSSILRARDEESRKRERQGFVANLKRAAQYLKRV
jgi:uracil-DNA glycosylase